MNKSKPDYTGIKDRTEEQQYQLSGDQSEAHDTATAGWRLFEILQVTQPAVAWVLGRMAGYEMRQ